MPTHQARARMTIRALALVALTATANALAGCSSGTPTCEVEGVVTFKGVPVKEGTISFTDNAGHGTETKLDEGGRYVITKEGRLPPGEYTITITPATYLDDSDKKTPPAVEEKKAPNIPEKYRRQGSTPFKKPLIAGKNELNFDMTP